MSLFISSLGFEHGDGTFWVADKLGILLGSLGSAPAAFARDRALRRVASSPQVGLGVASNTSGRTGVDRRSGAA